jgi:hypothetical protein
VFVVIFITVFKTIYQLASDCESSLLCLQQTKNASFSQSEHNLTVQQISYMCWLLSLPNFKLIPIIKTEGNDAAVVLAGDLGPCRCVVCSR